MVENIQAIMKMVLKYAGERRMNAGYSGEHHDGGASALEEQVKFYKAGQAGTLPEEWKPYADQVKMEQDPDWHEYQRLKLKFE